VVDPEPSQQWARRSQALGVPSTRGYLLTVLGEFVLPVGGRVWTAALLDALGALGVEERTARQAVWRSAERGLLESERIGRRTHRFLTAKNVDVGFRKKLIDVEKIGTAEHVECDRNMFARFRKILFFPSVQL